MPLLEQLLETYPDKVKVVFKNFPLRNHKFARKAAIAALAAHQQGKFWPFHDMLFENFNKLSDAKIAEIAAAVGLDMKRYELDLKNPRILNQVNQDAKDGQQAGVRGTPSVFVNGRRLQDRSLEGFRKLVDRELTQLGKGQ